MPAFDANEYSKKIESNNLSDGLMDSFALEALKMAVAVGNRKSSRNLRHNS
ncbi:MULTISPECIES: hypothetical protein [Flavobacterium]|uniref:Uncharacterized protein n=1 Tax=Flavobacterium ginsengisoli TaxID=871694 RepID=A0ABP7G5P2_9FLAO|nr:hypothetical protein [Flavobacterium sp. IB48]MBJ2127301.1 hypothetical protein [Flavobacterium sp. IB48]